MEDAIALIALYTGEASEEKILSMSYPFFNRVLTQLGRKLHYDAAVGYAGNSFFKDSNKVLQETNPLNADKKNNGGSMVSQLAGILSNGGAKMRKALLG